MHPDIDVANELLATAEQLRDQARAHAAVLATPITGAPMQSPLLVRLDNALRHDYGLMLAALVEHLDAAEQVARDILRAMAEGPPPTGEAWLAQQEQRMKAED